MIKIELCIQSIFFSQRVRQHRKGTQILYLCKKRKRQSSKLKMLVNEAFDLSKNTTTYHKLLKRVLINEIFIQFRNTTVVNYSKLGNLNDANLTSITGFKNYQNDDFKNLFDSIILKFIMGILFLLVVVFQNFQILVQIFVGHP